MFSEKFTNLLEDRGITSYKVAKDLELPPQTVGRWKNGVTPDTKNIIALANYFDVEVGYFLDTNEAEEIEMTATEAVKPNFDNEIKDKNNNVNITTGMGVVKNVNVHGGTLIRQKIENKAKNAAVAFVGLTDQETDLLEGFRQLERDSKRNIMSLLYRELDVHQQRIAV